MNSLTSEPASERYESPLSGRYASPEMQFIFSPQTKYSTWRHLWVALAEAQRELGLPITTVQIEALKQFQDTLNLDVAAEYEEQLQHDVMAHIHAYSEQCPAAKSIIHLGATSCYVTDNTDLIQMRDGMRLLKRKLELVIDQLSSFAAEHASLATLAYTHLQPAQPTTVGKRACLWVQDFALDNDELGRRITQIPFLGVKGTTGTQASFLTLFEGDHTKVEELDKLVTAKMGFSRRFPLSGQTYTRKLDSLIINTLAEIAASAHKCATDLRLLAHFKEVEEPFKRSQVGSSAMPYKRNPMLSERICALSRFLISLSANPAYTHATQWFERTLDDSANRRLTLPEAFLTCDAILELLIRVTKRLVVYPAVIAKRLQEELPFMLTETILMHAVQLGGDRQELHERIRVHSQAAAQQVKEAGKENDLLQRIASDPAFGLSEAQLQQLIEETPITGCAAEQVKTYLQERRTQ